MNWVHTLVTYSKSILSTVFFYANFFFWQETGYFAGASEEMPFLHMWSLAVEEQYYIIFPVFMIAFWRFGKNYLSVVLIAITLASIIFSEWGTVIFLKLGFICCPQDYSNCLQGQFWYYTSRTDYKVQHLAIRLGLRSDLA